MRFGAFCSSLLGHLDLDRGSSSGCGCNGICVNSPVELLGLQGSSRVAVVDLTSVLAGGKAIDARNGVGDAVSTVIVLEELRRDRELVGITDSLAGGASDETARADAGVELQKEGEKAVSMYSPQWINL